ncbi:MAG: putative Ig domain-containing protein [Blastocatellia bacterium]
MNLQPIMRVVVCAAIVALCVAAAGWFPTQPVAGQETNQQTLHGAAALDQLKQDGQYDSLQAAMEQARFSVSHTTQTPLGRAAWHAPNPAAGYDAYVTETGVSLSVRGAVNDESFVSLSLHSLGYGAALQAVGPGKVSGDKQTINLTRYSGLQEWYVNGPDGLEHGFTLSEPPPGARQKGVPLRLALQVSEGWLAVASEDGKLVTLHGAGDEAVEYGKLVVRDKLGINIPARLTVAGEQVVIEAEDSDAVYPLTIDPLFFLQQRLTAADGAMNDYLGYAVALSGNTALVGAPYDDVNGMEQGSAYVFVRNGAIWTQQARLIAQQDGTSFDYFGIAVALDGNTALVGAVYGPGSANPEQGAVYVFVRGGTTWSQQARLNAGDGQSQDQFGAAVALDGDTALVGAFNHQISSTSGKTGAAYVFVRNGGVWAQQARLTANDGAADDQFGAAVALDGDTALIGAPADDVGANGNQGSAYLFTRNGASWTQQQRLNHTLPAANDQFGNAVALGGEKALIGAYLYESDDRGAVFTFRRSATGWTQTDRFYAPNPTAGAHFGVSVAMSGDTAVIGASLGLFTPGVDKRSAYVFVNDGDWEPVRQLGPELGSTNDGFGYAVALDGDTVLTGAYRGDAVASDQGAAFAFVLHDGRHVEQQHLTANDGAATDFFGYAVALSGDTLVVGAYRDDTGANTDQGSVYVFTRNGAGWTLQQKLIANDGAANDYFGFAVALSGDTLAVGASGDDIGANLDQGSVYVFTRSGATQPVWTQQQKLAANDGAAKDEFGFAVALDGDTLAVGAYADGIGTNFNQGSAYVFTRSGATQPVWTQQQKLTANDGAVNDYFGRSVALGGATLVVGADGDTIGANAFQGSAYVFTRGGATQPVWTQQQKLTANDGGASDYFGRAVAVSGDTLAVGAFRDTIGANVNQGSVYVFTRNGATQPVWTQQQKLADSDGARFDSFGRSIALSGDTLVVGVSGDTIGTNTNQGSAYVYTFLGYWVPQRKLTASDGAANDYFGFMVALSGDTVVVGTNSDDIGTNNDQGSAYVFVSPPCPVITLAPASLPGGAPGAAYNQQLTASGGGVGDYQFTVSGGALPPGLTLDPPGLLHGTPTAAGTYRFTITTTFLLSGCTGSRAYTVTILACPTITLNPATLPNGAVGAAYNQTLTAAGGAAPYSFVVAAGALPPGLSLSAGGVLSGAPTQAGDFNFTLRVSDANGCATTRIHALTIKAAAVVCVSAASYKAGAAPESIVAAFGAQMATQTQVASGLPLPTELAGVRVQLRDSLGIERLAPLFFVSPGQINFQIPAGTATGTATVSLSSGATGQVEITNTAPGLFAANADGQGVPAAVALRVRNGAQSYEAVARLEGNRFVPAPLDLGPAGEQVFLVLFGTGFRFRQTVSASIGGTNANVLFAGAVAGFAGLDQINLSLPRALIGRGEMDVTLRVDGVAANPVRISVR